MARESRCAGCGQIHDPMKRCAVQIIQKTSDHDAALSRVHETKPSVDAELIRYLVEQDEHRRQYMRNYMRDCRDKKKAKAKARKARA